METFSNILQHFGKGGIVAALFTATLGLFVFIERMSSKEARTDFAAYLKSGEFSRSTVHLPEDTLLVFQQVFGTRHFSRKCVRRSVIFSISAIVGLFVVAILNDPAVFTGLKNLRFGRDPWLASFIAWSIVIDYFNLLKSRAVLNALIAHQITRPSLLVIGVVVDYCLGLLIFFVGLFLLWWTLLPLLVVGRLAIPLNDLSGLMTAVVSVQTHLAPIIRESWRLAM